MPLKIKDKTSCRWDHVSLGEVMLRLDPGEGRVAHRARVPGLGRRRRIQRRPRPEALLRPGHRGRHRVRRQPGRPPGRRTSSTRAASTSRTSAGSSTTASGRTVRNGLNFTERGFGVRGALGCSDRGHTAASQLEARRHRLGRRSSARRARAGSTPAASSPRSPRPRRAVAKEAMEAARSHGTIVSYDLNYRPSLWKSIGGQKRAQEVNRELAQYVDVMIGNEEDFTACLGFEVEGVDEHLSGLDPEQLPEDDRARGGGVPQLQGRRHHPAQREDRHHQRLGRGLLPRRHSSTRRRRARTSRSWTASAAATPSPPASSTAS